MSEMPPIRIWDYYESPNELRFSASGGDEDFIVVVPPNMECPWKLGELGCCSNDWFRVLESGMVQMQIADENTGEYRYEDRGVYAPNFKGCTVVISSHA